MSKVSKVRVLFGTFVLATVGLVAGIGLVGCAKNPHAPASISGKISINGQPIRAGTMRFHTKAGNAYGAAYDASINNDGTYSATDIPEGELVITVETESISPQKKAPKGGEATKRAKAGIVQPPPPGMAAPPDLSTLYVKVPDTYANPNTSPLTVTVKSGRQVHNVELQ
jgi:hypothetical protein